MYYLQDSFLLEQKFDRLKEGKTIICTFFLNGQVTWKKIESEKANFIKKTDFNEINIILTY